MAQSNPLRRSAYIRTKVRPDVFSAVKQEASSAKQTIAEFAREALERHVQRVRRSRTRVAAQ